MTHILDPRKAALAILDHVLNRRQPLDSALEAAYKTWPVKGDDRAFARAIATIALRHMGAIEHIMTRFLAQGIPDKCRYADLVLRAGLAQILFMNVADHAAVDTSVKLIAGAKHRADRGLKPVINAILRRAIRERAALEKDITENPQMCLPPWLKDRWQARYGEAVLTSIAASLLEEPPLDLSVKEPESAEDLADRLGGLCLPNKTVRLKKYSDVTALRGFSDGAFWVQDAAASLPVRLLPGTGPVLDLCAAPGGKTLQLAAKAGEGETVTALDRSKGRLSRLCENLTRTQLHADIITADALGWTPQAPAGRVLLDAPCSATGTLRRHPDVGWLKSAGDLEKLADLQRRLLDHVAAFMAPGGFLIYCVCSLEPEEGEDQIAGFLHRHKDFRRLPIKGEELPELEEAVSSEGDVRTLPCHWSKYGGMDGFFIARLQKQAP